MDPILRFYEQNAGVFNAVIGLLVFGGMARLAFWHKREGMRIAAPLVLGLGLLLTLGLLTWARENSHEIERIGPWAAFVLIQAILLLIFAARRQSKRL